MSSRDDAFSSSSEYTHQKGFGPKQGDSSSQVLLNYEIVYSDAVVNLDAPEFQFVAMSCNPLSDSHDEVVLHAPDNSQLFEEIKVGS